MNTRALNKWSREVVEGAMRNVGAYRTVKGKRRKIDSSGRLRKSLKYDLGIVAERMYIHFYSTVDYANNVEEGRRRGKMPPTEPIKDWIRQKPLRLRDKKTGRMMSMSERNRKKVAFGIAVNIMKYGIKPTYFFRDAVEAKLDDMDDAVREFFLENIDLAIQGVEI